MKCVCGYEYCSDIKNSLGDEPFINLTTLKTGEKKSGIAHSITEFTPLFVCPKCGTVKINEKSLPGRN